MDRRRFLKLTAASLAATPFLEGCGTEPTPPPSGPPPIDADAYDGGVRVAFVPDDVPEDDATFSRGVQAGGMRSDDAGASVVFWTALGASASPAPDPAPTPTLRLRVWRDAEVPGEVVLAKDEEVTADADGFVKVRLEGLAPSTWYRYAFFVAAADGRAAAPADFSARSAVGRVRTAWPADWTWPVVVGATTCTSIRNAPFTALDRLAEEEIDVLVHLGDMVYADGSVTREEYRRHWRNALEDASYRALLPRQGGYSVWDDHEFDNNLDPEETNPEKIANGRAEFFANLPMEPNTNGGLWQSWRWGRTVEFFALDCRTERVPSSIGTEAPQYISPAQMAWLKRALTDSPCHFKVLLNSVPMTRLGELWAFASDRWQGYDRQRAELLVFLEENDVQNVWFLSGDFHLGFVSRVEPDGFGRNVFEAAVGPGGNLGNPLGYLATQPEYREQVFPSSQFFYGQGRTAATTLVFDPLRDAVHVRYVAGDGEVLFDDEIRRG